jgi:hypothetical protein
MENWLELSGGARATAAGDGKHPQQVVPPALMTRFHHIRGVFMTRALQFLNVFFVGNALSVTG